MPDRIVRDELMRSHRYVSLSSDTVRLLFRHLINIADDFGNTEGTTTALSLLMARQVNEETAAKWVSELADCDLIRAYESDGKRYIHIPRFRQRLRYLNGKHPRPPANLECSEIKKLIEKVRLKSDCGQTVVGRSEEKRREVIQPQRSRFALPEWVPQEAWQSFEETRKKLRKPLTDRARSLAIAQLAKLRDAGHDPVAVIEKTVLHGWQTFYPLDVVAQKERKVAL